MTRARLSIVPLGRDAASRLLPFVFGLLAFLAGLALAAVIVLSGAFERIGREDIDRLTVEVVPDENGATDARMKNALVYLAAQPGIAELRPLTEEETAALLEPWIDRASLPRDLPLPRLIDVRLEADARVDSAALAVALEQSVPGTQLDDPQAWVARLGSFGHSLAAIAGAVVALIAAATAVMTMVNTRMALAVHREVIELLHLMGARDGFVAHLFQRETLRLGLLGGGLGAALAAATLFGVGHVVQALDATIFLNVALAPGGYGALAALPVATGLIAMVTARLSVLRALKRLP